MKKGFVLLLIALVALSVFVGCKKDPEPKKDDSGKEPEKKTSIVGTAGPAGGIIIYDVDADNTTEDPDGPDNLKSDVCGWRYLEAAPADAQKNGIKFGYYVSNGTYLAVGTKSGIGDGKENTSKLVEKMGSAAVDDERDTTSTTSDYAAKKCQDYKVTTSDGKVITGWYLPSSSELSLMATYRKKVGLSDSAYWSSTEFANEFSDDYANVEAYYLETGEDSTGIDHQYKYSSYNIRAVRQVPTSELK